MNTSPFVVPLMSVLFVVLVSAADVSGVWSLRLLTCQGESASRATVTLTQDGESITWTGTGVGKFGPGGSVSYRGMLFFRTTSEKLARLNNACGAFEYEVDPSGNTVSKVWEWK